MVVKEQLKILEERMSRLERKLTEVACFEDVPNNTPERSGVVDGEMSFTLPHLVLADFHVDQDQQRVAGLSTSDEVQFGVMLGMTGARCMLAVVIFFVADWMKCNFIDAAISWSLKIEEANLDAKNDASSKRRRYYHNIILRRVITP